MLLLWKTTIKRAGTEEKRRSDPKRKQLGEGSNKQRKYSCTSQTQQGFFHILNWTGRMLGSDKIRALKCAYGGSRRTEELLDSHLRFHFMFV